MGVIAAAITIVALPAGLFGGPKTDKPVKVKHREKKERSVPAPGALVLLGVGAGVAGIVRHRERRRRGLKSGTL